MAQSRQIKTIKNDQNHHTVVVLQLSTMALSVIILGFSIALFTISFGLKSQVVLARTELIVPKENQVKIQQLLDRVERLETKIDNIKAAH